MTSQAEALLAQGENIRADDPILWAVIRGRSHEMKIALLTGQPLKGCRSWLSDLVKEKVLVRRPSQPHIYHLNPNHPQYQSYMKLKRFYEAIERKWLDEYPDIKPDDSLVSASVRKGWKEDHPEVVSTVRRFDGELTEKQAQFLRLVGELGAKQRTFSPRDVARAMGLTQAGYTKSNLDRLKVKGYVSEVIQRPSTWSLTEAGVEKYNLLKDAGIPVAQVKAKEGEELEIDIDSA